MILPKFGLLSVLDQKLTPRPVRDNEQSLDL